MVRRAGSRRRAETPRIRTPSVLLVLPQAERDRLAQGLARKGFRVNEADTPAQGLALLREHPVDFLVALADGAGKPVVRLCQAVSTLAPGAKKIAVSAREDAHTVLTLTNEAGVDCILPGPVSARRLYKALQRLWEDHLLEAAWLARSTHAAQELDELKTFTGLLEARVQERTEQLEHANEKLRLALEEIEAKNKALTLLNESLRIQSTTDHLTGLFNRREFLNRMHMEWGRHRRYHRPLSLIMLDIDHFKLVNDTYGHECGDTVLQTLASLIRRHQRSHDITCRYGGEEFLVLMPETTMASAFHVAEGLRRLVGTYNFRCKAHRIAVNVSLGVSAAAEHEPEDVDAFIKLADMGMYRAKSEGRNRTVILDPNAPDNVLMQTGQP